MIDVFLSYHHQDKLLAQHLSDAILRLGMTVWWDLDLVPGDNWRNEIEAVINEASATIVLWTPNSITSDWVLDEAEVAKNLGTLISLSVGLRVDQIPLGFRQSQIVSLDNWFETNNSTGELPSEVVLGLKKKTAYKSVASPQKTESDNTYQIEAEEHTPISDWKLLADANFAEEKCEEYRKRHGDEDFLYRLTLENLRRNTKPSSQSIAKTLWNIVVAVGVILGIVTAYYAISDRYRPSETPPVKQESTEVLQEAKDNDKIEEPKYNSSYLRGNDTPSKIVKLSDSETSALKGKKIRPQKWHGKISEISKPTQVELLSFPENVRLVAIGEVLGRKWRVGDFVEIQGRILDVSTHYKYVLINDAEFTEKDFREFRKSLDQYFEDKICLQSNLNRLGYNVGVIDGIIGSKTESAFKLFLADVKFVEQIEILPLSYYPKNCKVMQSLTSAKITDMKNQALEKKKISDANIAAQKKLEDLKKKEQSAESRVMEAIQLDTRFWEKTKLLSNENLYFEYLMFAYLENPSRELKARIRQQASRKENENVASKALGLTFNLAERDDFRLLINDDIDNPAKYRAVLRFSADEGDQLHYDEELHGLSTCLTYNLVQQCQELGICTLEDIYFSISSRSIQTDCLDMKKKDGKLNRELCSKYGALIEKKVGHKTTPAIRETTVKTKYFAAEDINQCYLHYDVGNLNYAAWWD